MRLGQIARKLGVSQAEIVRYLSGKNLKIEEGSNVKLEETHIRTLYAHFAPSENFELKQQDLTLPSLPPDKSVEKTLEPVVEPADLNVPVPEHVLVKETTTESDSPAWPTSPTVAPLSGDQGETIRAPKIELAGLKVIGKIELPQPKKKEVLPTDESSKAVTTESATPEAGDVIIPAAETPVINNGQNDLRRGNEKFQNRDGRRGDDKRRSQNKQTREQRPYKNPIAAQREREIEQERQRKKEKAEQDKERRTQNYQKRVKHSPPTKAVRLIEEPLEQMTETSLHEEPTTWFGKIIKWLRS